MTRGAGRGDVGTQGRSPTGTRSQKAPSVVNERLTAAISSLAEIAWGSRSLNSSRNLKALGIPQALYDHSTTSWQEWVERHSAAQQKFSSEDEPLLGGGAPCLEAPCFADPFAQQAHSVHSSAFEFFSRKSGFPLTRRCNSVRPAKRRRFLGGSNAE